MSARRCSEEAALELSLRHVGPQREKVEAIRVLDEFLGQFRLWGGQRAVEVRDRLTLAVEETALDLMNENVTAPAMLHGLPGIP